MGSLHTIFLSLLYILYCTSISLGQSIVSLGYQPLTSDEIQNSQEIQMLLKFGLQTVIDKGIQKGTLPNNTYDMTKLNKVEIYYDNDTSVYRYDVEFSDSATLVVRAVFILNYWPDTGIKKFVTSTYRILRTTYAPTEIQFVDIPIEDAEADPLIRVLVNFGVQQILRKGMAEGKLPMTPFSLSELQSAQRQVLPSATNYKFNALLDNNNGTKVIAAFVIKYVAEGRQMDLTASSFVIVGANGQTELAQADLQSDRSSNGLSKPVAIDPSTVKTDPVLQMILNFGIAEVTKSLVRSGKVNSTTFVATEVRNITKQIVNGINYKFDATLSDNNGTNVETMFTVFYQPALNKTSLAVYSYTISVLVIPNWGIYVDLDPVKATSNSSLKAILDFGIQKVIENGYENLDIPEADYTLSKVKRLQKQAYTDNANYQFDIELANPDGGVLYANFIVKYFPKSGQTVLVFQSHNFVS